MIYLIIGGLAIGLLLAGNTQVKATNSDYIDPFFRWDGLFKKYGEQYGIPWRWLKSICMVESDLGRARSVKLGLDSPSDVNNSKSSDGKSWGIMQTTLSTARQFESSITEVGLNDPEISVRIAAKYLSWIGKNYFAISSGNRESVIRSYNGGPGFRRTAQGIRDTPFYYSKFLDNLALVKNQQPGNEME